MGLDIIEMVERIENEFGVSIPDDVASTLTTPRLVTDHLMTVPEISTSSDRETVRLKLWFVLEDELGIERHFFTDDSRFVQDFRLG